MTAPVERQPLTHAQAQALDEEVGCLLAELFGPPMRVHLQSTRSMSHAKATALAKKLTDRHADRTYVVFRPSATYHGVAARPDTPPAGEGEG